jgi:hypothetical protein
MSQKQHRSVSAFALLGHSELEKSALFESLGQTFQAAGNKISAGVQGALQSTKSNLAGAGALLTGEGFRGAANAADKSWNDSSKDINAANQRAAGHEQTAAGLSGEFQAGLARPLQAAGGAFRGFLSGGLRGAADGQDQGWNAGTKNINAAKSQIAQGQRLVGANSPGFAAPAGANSLPAPAPVTPAGSNSLPAPAPAVPPPVTPAGSNSLPAPTAPNMQQFNQPGGWTTGPNGQIQPMTKSSFAALGKSAMYYGSPGLPFTPPAPARPDPVAPPTPPVRMSSGTGGAFLGPSGGMLTGGTGLREALGLGNGSAAPAPKIKMPAAGTPVTPGMETDERMHAENKLNASAGGTVAAQKAPASTGPSADQLAQFRKGTASDFDPKSDLDRSKMDALIAGNKGWASNQAARGAMASATGAGKQKNSAGRIGREVPPAYPKAQIVKGALFAALDAADMEKEALAKGIGKGLTHLGKFLRASGTAAKQTAYKSALTARGVTPESLAASGKVLRKMDTAAGRDAMKATGAYRGQAGRVVSNAGKALQGNGLASKAVNYGAVGVGGLGAYGLGSSNGYENGANAGFDSGVEAGIEQMNQPGEEQGVFGRIANVFTGGGEPQGPNAGVAYGNIGANRDAYIDRLLQQR